MEKLIQVKKPKEFKLPNEAMSSLKLKPLDNLFIFTCEDYIMIKKIKPGSIKERFNTLSAKVRKKFKDNGITEKNVQEAIAWGRK